MTEERMTIPLKDLRPNPCQPPERTVADMFETESLARSIQQEGLHYPIVVRMVENHLQPLYEVADGWQRKTAFQWLVDHGYTEYDHIPATLRGYTDEQMADIILTTSERSKPLSSIGRAWLYRKYLADHPDVTQAKYAERRGVSQAEIANTIRLLELPERVQQMIISREISESHGRILLRVKDPLIQADFAHSVTLEGWSVAHLDEKVKAYLEAIAPRMTGGTATEDKEVTSREREEREGKPVVTTTPPVTQIEPETREAVTEMAGAAAEQMAGQTQEVNQPEQGQETPAPAASPSRQQATTPVTPGRNWGRKLVIEEREGHILMSCMKAGGVPAFKKVEGGLVENMPVATGWLCDLEAEWAEAEKGGK